MTKPEPMSRVNTAATPKKTAKKGKGHKPKVISEPNAKNQFSIGPKDEAWLNRKLRDYHQLIGKSIDAETIFVGKEKEWLAAMKIGRQSARDRFGAGMTLLEIQEKITDEIGYPFWRWLTAMGVPNKTAQRAIEMAKFYKVECNLGDKTITECYAEIKAAKAKVKVKNHDDDDTEEEVEQQDEQDANEDDQENEIAGKIGKDPDSVSKTLPILTTTDNNHDENSNDEDKELFGQEALAWELEDIEELLQESLKSLDGDLGLFPEPEQLVQRIERCIELCEQLKVKIPVNQ